ncbi:hypothetical protein D3C84_829770 [compost metagenome]
MDQARILLRVIAFERGVIVGARKRRSECISPTHKIKSITFDASRSTICNHLHTIVTARVAIARSIKTACHDLGIFQIVRLKLNTFEGLRQ